MLVDYIFYNFLNSCVREGLVGEKSKLIFKICVYFCSNELLFFLMWKGFDVINFLLNGLLVFKWCCIGDLVS